MSENDIRNFAFNFENHISKIILLYTPIRSEETQENVSLFDVFHKNHGTASQAVLKTNLCIKKEMCCYGGLYNVCSFLVAIEVIDSEEDLLNDYLTLIKSIFKSKPGSQE